MIKKPQPDKGHSRSDVPEDDASALSSEQPPQAKRVGWQKPDADVGEAAARRDAEDMTNDSALPGLVSEDIGGAGAALNSML